MSIRVQTFGGLVHQGRHSEAKQWIDNHKIYGINSLYREYSPLTYAIMHGNWEIFKYILINGGDFIREVKRDNLFESLRNCEFIDQLLNTGIIEVNIHLANEDTLLHCAIWHGNIKLVRLLLEKYKINFTPPVTRSTYLSFAARHGRYKIVRYFIERGLFCLGQILMIGNGKQGGFKKTRSVIIHSSKIRNSYIEHQYRRMKKIGYLSQIPGDIIKLIVNYI